MQTESAGAFFHPQRGALPTLAARRSTEKQRHLPIGHRLLRQIIKDNQRMHSVVTEVLTQGATRVWRKKLQGRSVGGGRRDNDGVVHGASIAQGLHELRDGRTFLPDSDVDAEERLGWLRLGAGNGQGQIIVSEGGTEAGEEGRSEERGLGSNRGRG